ncbi:MAG: hypothetical protein IT287_01810, partial [Bdellovibrionaceae bacterium]|nr:hypothetical protein [Pseudobdellovibrionaceae bacterium]
SKAVFTDRPTLNKDPAILNMPKDTFLEREKKYAQIADEELLLPEGIYYSHLEEQKFFTHDIKKVGGALTLLKWQLERSHSDHWLRQRDNWGLQAFELRNDLLTSAHIQKIIAAGLKTPLLFSFRKSNNLMADIQMAKACQLVDWDLALGVVPTEIQGRSFVSLHSEEKTFAADLEKLDKYFEPIKWSPVISDFSDLEKGHKWMQVNPQQRAFLPRSQDGRWQWYRRLIKNEMLINFFREGKGSSIDQPSLLQWISTYSSFPTNAAIIGDPIVHSWSPIHHRLFFNDLGMNFFSIQMSLETASASAMTFLYNLGFRAFAVTSPLKKWAAKFVDSQRCVNTLVWSKSKNAWEGYFTDMIGFEQQLSKASVNIQTLKTAIWGSGAMAEEIKAKYSEAIIYSARTGETQEEVPVGWAPQAVIWASGDVGADTFLEKHPDWKPIWIVDLNYRQDSPGIIIAHKVDARYVSGMEMFSGQASEQQKIWKKELKK